MWRERKHKILIIDEKKHCKKIIKHLTLQRGIYADYSDIMTMEDKIREFKPDVILFDTEGFKLHETEIIRKKISNDTIPVLALASSGEGALDAMFAGVHDFIAKPDMKCEDEVNAFINELAEKIKVLKVAKRSFRLSAILK